MDITNMTSCPSIPLCLLPIIWRLDDITITCLQFLVFGGCSSVYIWILDIASETNVLQPSW